jgi:triosephosphate isomerase
VRKKYVMGNWKMNGTRTEVNALATEIIETIPLKKNCQSVVLPPAIYLPLVSELISGSDIEWGAQNIYQQNSGAYTGEISPLMVKDYQGKYILVGHSERRHLLGENEKIVAEKFHLIKVHDMIPVLCIGETLEERDKGLTEQVLKKQLLSIQAIGADFSNSIIAYEPVWAIGTGKTAIPNDVQLVHALIRSFIGEINNSSTAQATSILYGGSVNEKNALGIFSMPDVDGGLIGGASLNAHQFVEIIKCIN